MKDIQNTPILQPSLNNYLQNVNIKDGKLFLKMENESA